MAIFLDVYPPTYQRMKIYNIALIMNISWYPKFLPKIILLNNPNIIGTNHNTNKIEVSLILNNEFARRSSIAINKYSENNSIISMSRIDKIIINIELSIFLFFKKLILERISNIINGNTPMWIMKEIKYKKYFRFPITAKPIKNIDSAKPFLIWL